MDVLNEGSLDSQLALYPNPAASTVTVKLKNAAQSAAVIDARGSRSPLPLAGESVRVDGLTTGVYLLEVQTTNGQVLRQRFVKE